MNESNNQNYNGSGPDGPGDYNRYKALVARRNMATAALVCAIIAVLSFQLFFICLPLAGASIILALLSRGNGRIQGRARIALIAGIAAAVFSCLFTWYAIRTVYKDPALRAQVQQIYNYYTGQISGNAESEGTSSSENPQDLIRDILSGDYRENQQAAPSGDTFIPENGGALI